jgi:hypothetical protein
VPSALKREPVLLQAIIMAPNVAEITAKILKVGVQTIRIKLE